MIQLKKVYEPVSTSDGKRFLIERLWPRGIKRSALKMTAWAREAGPSRELRVLGLRGDGSGNNFREAVPMVKAGKALGSSRLAKTSQPARRERGRARLGRSRTRTPDPRARLPARANIQG